MNVRRNTTNQLLRLEAVAERCGVGVKTVQRWVNDDGLPSYQLPGRGGRTIIVVSQDDLKAWLERFRVDQCEPEQTIRIHGRKFFTSDKAAIKPQNTEKRRGA